MLDLKQNKFYFQSRTQINSNQGKNIYLPFLFLTQSTSLIKHYSTFSDHSRISSRSNDVKRRMSIIGHFNVWLIVLMMINQTTGKEIQLEVYTFSSPNRSVSLDQRK
jgi:hypothetical protein